MYTHILEAQNDALTPPDHINSYDAYEAHTQEVSLGQESPIIEF